MPMDCASADLRMPRRSISATKFSYFTVLSPFKKFRIWIVHLYYRLLFGTCQL
nr:MAG TPA: hypothetical protein [Caudoviricetes sp.]